jgi:hypothetical protein
VETAAAAELTAAAAELAAARLGVTEATTLEAARVDEAAAAGVEVAV